MGVLRLGNATFSATGLPHGTALPLFVDYYDVGGGGASPSPFRSVPLELPHGSPRRRWCTLARGTPALDAEGLPSNSVNRRLALVPCYNVAPGVRGVIATRVVGNRSLGVVADARSLAAIHRVPIGDGLSASAGGATSGFRTVASRDGSAFYTASIAARDFGIRYFVPGDNTSVRISGELGQHPRNGFSQGGTNDIRSLALARSPTRLYALSSPLDAGWDTVFSVCAFRDCNASLPVSAARQVEPLLPPLASAWAFVFEGVWSVWLSMEGAGGGAQLRKYENSVHLSGQQARRNHWVTAYTKEPSDWPTARVLRSLAGRSEPDTRSAQRNAFKFVLYAADTTSVYRIDTLEPDRHTVVATAPPHTQFRGVVLPPRTAPTATPSPMSTRSRLPTPPASRSVIASKSRSSKARPR